MGADGTIVCCFDLKKFRYASLNSPAFIINPKPVLFFSVFGACKINLFILCLSAILQNSGKPLNY